MRRIIRDFLEDEERASTILIIIAVALMAVGLIVAAGAIFYVR